MQILDRVNLYSHRHSRVQLKNLQSIARSYKVSWFLQRRAKTLAERCTASRQVQTLLSRNLTACSERWRAPLSANHSSSRSSGRILGQLVWRVTACCLMWRDLPSEDASLSLGCCGNGIAQFCKASAVWCTDVTEILDRIILIIIIIYLLLTHNCFMFRINQWVRTREREGEVGF